MTAERKPCAGWRVDHEGVSILDLSGVVWRVIKSHYTNTWRWWRPGYSADARSAPTLEAAQLAAEDAARALLIDALAVLAPGMPEGWRIERFKSSIVLRDHEDVGVFAGSEAKAEALALGMLAAVRK